MNNLNTKQILIDWLVKAMLNKNNKDFYIGNTTLDDFQDFIKNDSDRAEVVFTAFGIAQAKYLDIIEEEIAQAYDESVLLDDIACEYAKHGNHSYYGDICPQCLCTQSQGYINGTSCPNCEYVEW